MQREPAAHGFVHCLFDGKLRESAFGPEALENFAAMFDLDVRAGFTIAATPQRHKLVARLHAPRGGLEHVWQADAELRRLRVEHLDGRAGGDFFAKAILRFEDHAVCAFLEFEVEVRLSAGVGGETFLGNHFAELPRIDIRGIRRGHKLWRKPAVAMRHHVARIDELGALDVGGLFQR
ncbi:MAG TPA: hypothetical protein EYQ62_02730, partial [Verrucomicrobiales bacterium]|nr:hypothetical protein [Verrucomicrobiales bacterium]